MRDYEILWPEWNELINERFVPLVDNTDRYLILWGGRGSSKSDFAAKKLIYRCLTEKYFRYILVRNEYISIKDSQFQTLKDIVFDLGLDPLFQFKVSPLEIVCINGNKFLARGCDDTTRLKSIKDPTGAWYEEDIISEKDFITITTSIRTSKANYLQEIFSINPEVEGDYTQNWFWKKFFEDKLETSFTDITRVEIDQNKTIEMRYTSHHSTHKDNRYIPDEFIAFLQELKKTNPYYYTIYCLGRWGNKITGGQFYKLFSIGKNVSETKYNPSLPLWLSFDFNVLPGVSCGIFQIESRKMKMIDEIQLPSPNNTTSNVCREVIRKYQNHSAGMLITGDPAGVHEDTRSEKGFNDYTIIQQELKQFLPSMRYGKLAPPVVMRGNFINTIFETGYEGIEIIIGNRCSKMINDLLYGLEASDGTKLKQKVKDADTGATFEKHHHFTDLLDYAVTSIFPGEFDKYRRGGRPMLITYGKNISNHNSAYK
ncbi:PBSX family phage terminase large subunit [Ginsengibacter hankyongi]|uniref:PBSX family phage terminase large subunit n=1 Tax=Ginsengibacter hankyongi TaxID=2607284 RepID=A0A5J5INN8_9BACT|nr:PBSX family phage terminase large subunit [Ginsengibacter hankyongi]KAA9041617.1 PBSX family phage terminase large subunit [Ginsengibacter hankyongi]